jgi:aryl-alcohol dehydrogenase-like predicted oxidoreductase
MHMRRLGTSGLVVSHICLGTMTYGEQNTEAEAHEQLDYAWDHGINCLDTAEMYAVPTRPETQGLSEAFVGSWMKARRNRDKVIIFGKVTSTSPKTWIPPNRIPPQPAAVTRLTPQSIRGAVEGSLRRLQTDCVDLVELHWPERYVGTLFGAYRYERAKEQKDVVPFEDQVGALARLIEEGKLRAWGLSNETTYGLCQFHAAAKRLGVPPPATVQNDFSLLDRTVEPEIAEAIAPRHLDIALLVYGALNGGTLTGKYIGGDPPGARHTRWPTFQPRYHTQLSRWATERYAEIARKHGLTLTEMALAFAYSREYIASTIIGATRMEHLKACIAAKDVTLSPDCLADIEEQHMRLPNPNKAARAISPGFVTDVRKGT